MPSWVQRHYVLLFALAGVAVVMLLPPLLPGHHANHWGRRAVIACVVALLHTGLAWLMQRRERAQRAYHQDLLRNYLQKICLVAPDALELVAEARLTLDRMDYGR